MTTPCPNGHQSTDPEWCDTCGAPLGTPAAGVASGSASGSGPAASGSAPSAAPISGVTVGVGKPGVTINCPSCGDTNAESNLFCESCGLDFVTGQVPTPPSPPATAPDPVLPAAAPAAIAPPVDPGTDLGWTVTLAVDTEWFAAKGEGIGTPPSRAERVQELRHSPLVIGRTRSAGASPGIVIDDDHGISRRHAEVTHDPATDSWSITDLGSTNGTFVVTSHAEIQASMSPVTPNTPTPLSESDRVFVGAWTRVTIARTTPSPTSPTV
jgi:FHA domain